MLSIVLNSNFIFNSAYTYQLEQRSQMQLEAKLVDIQLLVMEEDAEAQHLENLNEIKLDK